MTRFRTVVIDPPWPVEPISVSAARKMRYGPSMRIPYRTIDIDQITRFPINDFADDQCALFMWTTQGFLKDALNIVDLWGFKFARLLVWDKDDGINWLGFRNNGEFVVFAYRGKYPILIKPKGTIYTVFKVRRTRHSEKPVRFYDMIRNVTPEPRVDLFARRRHYGFEAWGDQAEAPLITLESYGQNNT